MSIISGCQEGKVTPKLVEVKCPNCGDVIELFVKMGGSLQETGRTVGDSVCEKCGFVVQDGSNASAFELF